MRQILRVGLTALAAALLLPISAYAQTGQMNGAVRDASGGALPGVLVEVTSPALIEKVRSTTTDPNGRYQITVLPVGTFSDTSVRAWNDSLGFRSFRMLRCMSALFSVAKWRLPYRR